MTPYLGWTYAMAATEEQSDLCKGPVTTPLCMRQNPQRLLPTCFIPLLSCPTYTPNFAKSIVCRPSLAVVPDTTRLCAPEHCPPPPAIPYPLPPRVAPHFCQVTPSLAAVCLSQRDFVCQDTVAQRWSILSSNNCTQTNNPPISQCPAFFSGESRVRLEQGCA